MGKSVFIRAVGAIIVALISSVGYALDIAQIADIGFKWWPLIGFGVFVIIAITIFVGLEKQLKKIRERTPRLVLKEIEGSYLGDYFTFVNNIVTKREKLYYTKIDIANIPLKPELGIEAKQVYAEISFWDYPYSTAVHNRYFKMGGRWAETKQIIEGGKPIEIEQLNLQPNGRGFTLDIGVKSLNEDEFYAINNETFINKTGFRDKARKLDIGVYNVQVHLMCEGVDISHWLKLENPGKGKEIILKYLPASKSRKE